MRRQLTWLLVSAGLALMLALVSARPVAAHGWGAYYHGYGPGCYYPRRVYYAPPVPVVRYYRAPVVVARPWYAYPPPLPVVRYYAAPPAVGCYYGW